MPWMIELEAAADDAGTLITHHWASGRGHVTGPAETPAHTIFQARVIDPGNTERHLFGSGRTRGASSVGYGKVDINNMDGKLDTVLMQGMGRPLIIRKGPRGAAYPADFPVQAALIAEQAEAPDVKTLRLLVRDRQSLVRDKVFNPEKYAGDNILPDGVEGTADDIGGDNKPAGWGVYRNVEPRCVNTSKHIYQVSVDTGQTATPTAVRDDGSTLTPGVQRASVADLELTAPAVGIDYDWCHEAGKGLYVRLDAEPTSTLTVDATEGADAAARTTAQLIRRILTGPGGLTDADLDLDSFAALDALNSAVVGFWTDGETTVGTALDTVAGSVGAWWLDDLGLFRVGRLDAPTGMPVKTIHKWELLGDPDLMTSSDEGDGLPVWRVTVTYRPNYTEQDRASLSGIAGVDEALLATLEQPHLTVVAEDAAVQVKHPNAVEITVETQLDDAGAAQAEADRLLALYRVKRLFPAVRVPLTRLGAAALGTVIALDLNRFGFSGGKLLRVLGLTEERKSNVATLYCWG